ncbi:MAG TPA: VIT domain-containing protein, partial [Planctomycetaceae bacterium]
MRWLLMLVAFTGTGIANCVAADAPPERSAFGVGQLLVTDPQSGTQVRLNLARHHVHVVLHPPVALVQIDQSFYNPYQFQQEGKFVFNLPDGASVSRFAMFTTRAQLIEGELIDRARAAGIYQSIVDRQRDPAILEQIGGNLFKMRVFPIPPRDTKRILLDYTVPLVEGAGGHCEFELPLMADVQPIGDFAITGAIRGPNVTGSAKSESHPEAKFDAAEGNVIRFELRKSAFRPVAPFTLRFQQQPSGGVTVRSYVPDQLAAVQNLPDEK